MTGLTGRTYLECGQPVTVVTQWAAPRPLGPGAAAAVMWLRPPRPAPRNVLIRRPSGALVVRPFRGLRTPPATIPGSAPQGGETL
jgi:acetyl esterase